MVYFCPFPVAGGVAGGGSSRIFAGGGLKLRVLLWKYPPPRNHFKARWQTIAPEGVGGRIYPGGAWQGGGRAAAAFAVLGVCFLALSVHFVRGSWLDHNFSKSKICGEPSPAAHLGRGVHGWKDPDRGGGVGRSGLPRSGCLDRSGLVWRSAVRQGFPAAGGGCLCLSRRHPAASVVNLAAAGVFFSGGIREKYFFGGWRPLPRR